MAVEEKGNVNRDIPPKLFAISLEKFEQEVRYI